jgi:glutamate-1-semialdehyde 2,1-aminomutase
MARKRDDHHASHSDKRNQALHLVSSSVFIYCYARIFGDLTTAMCLGLASLFLRQFGHAVLEPVCHEKEALLLGYNTPKKTLIVLGYALVPVIEMARAHTMSLAGFTSLIDPIALQWFRWTVFVILARVAYLAWTFDARTSMIWFVKLVTDPFTDIAAYFPRRILSPRA